MSLYALLRASDGVVKFGWSESPGERLYAHRYPRARGMTDILAVGPGSREDETELLRSISTSPVTGREWFPYTQSVRSAVERIRRSAVSAGWRPWWWR